MYRPEIYNFGLGLKNTQEVTDVEILLGNNLIEARRYSFLKHKSLLLGDNRSKIKVERLRNRQVQPKHRRGDRWSEVFKKKGH